MSLWKACQALAVPRSVVYRRRQVIDPTVASEPVVSARALAPAEKAEVRQVLNSERFADQAPREVFATLMDEGKYLCSWRTMYRILDENKEVRERRNQLRHPHYAKPALELGHHQTAGTDQVDLLLSLQHPGCIQSILRGLDDRRT